MTHKNIVAYVCKNVLGVQLKENVTPRPPEVLGGGLPELAVLTECRVVTADILKEEMMSSK